MLIFFLQIDSYIKTPVSDNWLKGEKGEKKKIGITVEQILREMLYALNSLSGFSKCLLKWKTEWLTSILKTSRMQSSKS